MAEITPGVGSAPLNAAQTLAQLKKLEATREASAPAKGGAAPTDDAKVIEKDTFVNHAAIAGKSKTDLEALYEKFDADGTEGLSDNEFDQLFNEAIAKPAAAPAAQAGDVVVQSGDSLSKIAKQMTGDAGRWKEFYDLNKDVIGQNPNLISPGMKLKVPAGWSKETAQPAEKPAEAGQPAGGAQPADKPAEQPSADKPAEKPATDKPAEKPAADKPVEGAKPTQKPAEKPKPAASPEEQVAAQRKALEAKLSQKAGHDVQVVFPDEKLEPAEQSKQLANLQKMVEDPKNDVLWQSYRQVQFNTYDKAKDSGDANNLDKYVETDGSVLKINNAAKDGLTDVEADKQLRAIEKLGAPARTAAMQAQVEAELAEVAGHPVKIEFEEGGFDAEAQARQLAVIRASFDDPKAAGVWKYYDKVQFNTYENAKDSGDLKNLSRYAEVSNRTLKLNNAGQDGLTDVEIYKQLQALRQVADTGEGT